jgi:ABC-2 type transport system ATP-binding protein
LTLEERTRPVDDGAPVDRPLAALEAAGLVKRYGQLVVLDGVSLALASGVVYGLAGPNGSGKTSLLRILGLLERPNAGRVRVLGVDPLVDPGAARRLIGYAGPPIGTPTLTVAEELDLAAQLRGVGAAERRETVGVMLQLVELHDRRRRPVGQLSLGELKRLALARALVHDPAVLLLDGPFDGLDAGARAELRAVLAELPLMGKTLLATGATVAELAGLCDEVGLLERGRIVMSGPPDQILAGGEPGRPLRLSVAAGGETARRLLEGHPSASAVTQLDDATLLFRLRGDAAAQAALLAELLAAGVAVAELATAREEAEAELARAGRSGG